VRFFDFLVCHLFLCQMHVPLCTVEWTEYGRMEGIFYLFWYCKWTVNRFKNGAEIDQRFISPKMVFSLWLSRSLNDRRPIKTGRINTFCAYKNIYSRKGGRRTLVLPTWLHDGRSSFHLPSDRKFKIYWTLRLYQYYYVVSTFYTHWSDTAGEMFGWTTVSH
jgi:hypothetical protein